MWLSERHGWLRTPAVILVPVVADYGVAQFLCGGPADADAERWVSGRSGIRGNLRERGRSSNVSGAVLVLE